MNIDHLSCYFLNHFNGNERLPIIRGIVVCTKYRYDFYTSRCLAISQRAGQLKVMNAVNFPASSALHIECVVTDCFLFFPSIRDFHTGGVFNTCVCQSAVIRSFLSALLRCEYAPSSLVNI